jgi:hypothetical protein
MKGRIMSAHTVASAACIFYARTKLCPLTPELDTPRCKKLHSFRRNRKPLCFPHTHPPPPVLARLFMYHFVSKCIIPSGARLQFASRQERVDLRLHP